jgi:hypothetical protein
MLQIRYGNTYANNGVFLPRNTIILTLEIIRWRALEIFCKVSFNGEILPSSGYRGSFSLRLKRGRGVTLTTHPHLVPTWRMSRNCTSSSPSASMACGGWDSFSFYSLKVDGSLASESTSRLTNEFKTRVLVRQTILCKFPWFVFFGFTFSCE